MVVVVMIVIMMVVVMIMVMIMVMIVVVVMILVVLMVGVMSHVGCHDTRQAGRSMGMVVAIPGLSRSRGGRERYSAETGGGGESQHTFSEHEAYSS